MNTKITDKLKAINTSGEIVEYMVINGKVTCSQHNLKEILYIPDNLTYLICYDNQLTSLPELNNISRLYCSKNLLIELPELPNVKILACTNNKLTYLPELPNIVSLLCDDNDFIFKSNEPITTKNYKNYININTNIDNVQTLEF